MRTVFSVPRPKFDNVTSDRRNQQSVNNALYLQVIIIFSCVQYDGMNYKDYTYPPMAESVAWLLVVVSLVAVPSWMITRLWEHVGNCKVGLGVYQTSTFTISH